MSTTQQDLPEGLGVLGFLRLNLTFLYCLLLTLIPIIIGWVVAYRLWIHKWNWVREILWRDPPHNRTADNRARGTYLPRRQSSFPAGTTSTSAGSSTPSSSSSKPKEQ